MGADIVGCEDGIFNLIQCDTFTSDSHTDDIILWQVILSGGVDPVVVRGTSCKAGR